MKRIVQEKWQPNENWLLRHVMLVAAGHLSAGCRPSVLLFFSSSLLYLLSFSVIIFLLLFSSFFISSPSAFAAPPYAETHFRIQARTIIQQLWSHLKLLNDPHAAQCITVHHSCTKSECFCVLVPDESNLGGKSKGKPSSFNLCFDK